VQLFHPISIHLILLFAWPPTCPSPAPPTPISPHQHHPPSTPHRPSALGPATHPLPPLLRNAPPNSCAVSRPMPAVSTLANLHIPSSNTGLTAPRTAQRDARSRVVNSMVSFGVLREGSLDWMCWVIEDGLRMCTGSGRSGVYVLRGYLYSGLGVSLPRPSAQPYQSSKLRCKGVECSTRIVTNMPRVRLYVQR
jgi:hypothetical protein